MATVFISTCSKYVAHGQKFGSKIYNTFFFLSTKTVKAITNNSRFHTRHILRHSTVKCLKIEQNNYLLILYLLYLYLNIYNVLQL